MRSDLHILKIYLKILLIFEVLDRKNLFQPKGRVRISTGNKLAYMLELKNFPTVGSGWCVFVFPAVHTVSEC